MSESKIGTGATVGDGLKDFTSPHRFPVPSFSHALTPFALHFSCPPFCSLLTYLTPSQVSAQEGSLQLQPYGKITGIVHSFNPHRLPLLDIQGLCDVTAKPELAFS